MRIVLTCRATGWHRPGGLGHVIQTRAVALAKAGHDVHVLTTGVRPTALAAPRDAWDGLTIHEVSPPADHYDDQFASGCTAKCRELQPDVIHMDSFDRLRHWWAERPGSPQCVATTLHGEDIGCTFTQWRLWRDGKRGEFEWDSQRIRELCDAMHTFDRVISTALFDQWIFADLLGCGVSPLVYNPVPEFFYENTTEPDPAAPYLFSAMWGSAERGLPLAREAAAKAGVALLQGGKFQRTALPQRYDSSRALLLPSYQSQGYDLSVAESLVRRRPVIASNVGLWSCEAHARSWIKCLPVNDADAWADALKQPMPHVPAMAGFEFRPATHVSKWLEALDG